MRGLRLGLGLGRGGGNAAAFTVSIGSGPFTTGTELTAVITPDPAPATPTYQWTDDGVNIAGATSASYTPAIGTDSVADASLIRCVVTIGGEDYTSPARQIRYAAGTFGALTNQSFTDDTGNQTYTHAAATGTGLTWTYAASGLISGVTYDAAARTFTFDTDALAIQSGTTITVTATDQYGRAATGSPRTFTLAITEAPVATNPVLASVTFSSPGSGLPQQLALSYSYPNDPAPDTLRLIVATRNGGSALSAAQLLAGTGTFLERVVVNPFTASTFTFTGFTATSEAATAVDVILAEVNNGGQSAVVTEAVSNLDFTTETRVSIATNSAGDQIVITYSGTLFDPASLPDLAPSDYTMPGHTINTAVASGDTVTLGISASVANGDSDTLSYLGTALKDVNGNTIATFSSAAVTNNVPGGPLIDEDFSGLADAANITSLSGWEGVFSGNGGRFLGDGTGLLRMNSSTATNAPQVRVRNTTVLPTGVRIELDFVEPDPQTAVNSATILGLIGRQSSDADTGYEVRYHSESNATNFFVRLAKRVAGSSSTIQTETGERTLPFTLAAEFTTEGSDCRIKVFVGATEVINYLDTSSPLTGTRMGLFGFHQTAAPGLNNHTHLITAVRAEAL